MDTVLLTGATGFIGGYVARELAARGIAAVACGQRPQADVPSPLRYVSCNLLEEQACRSLCEALHPSYLLHLAWDMTPGRYNMGASNIAWLKATLHLVEAFCRCGGKRFCGGGTCHEYEDVTTARNEHDTPTLPESIYGAGKIAAFHGVRALCRVYGVSMVWGRLFSVFGPGDSPHRLLPGAWNAVARGEDYTIRTGERLFDFIDVRDAARMLVALMFSDVEGACNIGTGRGLSAKRELSAFFERHGMADKLKVEDSSSSTSPVADMTKWKESLGVLSFIPLWESLEDGLSYAERERERERERRRGYYRINLRPNSSLCPRDASWRFYLGGYAKADGRHCFYSQREKSNALS